MDETDWEYENELALLEEGLTLIADKCRADETKKMVNAIEVRHELESRVYVAVLYADMYLADQQAPATRASRGRLVEAGARHVGYGFDDVSRRTEPGRGELSSQS